MNNKIGLSGLQRAAAASLLALVVSGDQNNTLTAAEKDAAKFFMSPETRATYGAQIDIIRDYVPGLTALVLTDKDIGIEITEEDKTNIAIFTSCAGQTVSPTVESIDTFTKYEQAEDTIFNILKTLSTEKDPIINENDFQNILLNNPRKFMNIISSATGVILTGQSAATSFTDLFPHAPDMNVAIIAMPSKMDTVEKRIEGVTGLPAEYIENIPINCYRFFPHDAWS